MEGRGLRMMIEDGGWRIGMEDGRFAILSPPSSLLASLLAINVTEDHLT
jgi:hypothetical protein